MNLCFIPKKKGILPHKRGNVQIVKKPNFTSGRKYFGNAKKVSILTIDFSEVANKVSICDTILTNLTKIILLYHIY